MLFKMPNNTIGGQIVLTVLINVLAHKALQNFRENRMEDKLRKQQKYGKHSSSLS